MIHAAMHHAPGAREGHVDGNGRNPRLLEGMLSQVSLFRGVSQRALAELAARSRTVHARRGDRICAVNDGAGSIYAIAYGRVKLALRRADGEERVLRIAGPGDTFDLAVALLGRALPYEAAALEDTLVILVPAPAVQALVANDPRFMRGVLGELAESNLSLLAEVESGSLQRGLQRLASYLDSLAEPNGSDGTWCVHLPTTKTVVAARLGVKKETLSRMLRALVKKRLIAVEQRDIAILDRYGLAAVAREPS